MHLTTFVLTKTDVVFVVFFVYFLLYDIGFCKNVVVYCMLTSIFWKPILTLIMLTSVALTLVKNQC